MIVYPHESGVSEIDDSALLPRDGCAALGDGACPGGLAFAGGENCCEPAPDTLRTPPPIGCEAAKASCASAGWGLMSMSEFDY